METTTHEVTPEYKTRYYPETTTGMLPLTRARDSLEQAKRQAFLRHVQYEPPVERRQPSPVVLDKLGHVATNVGNETEGIVMELLYGAGLRNTGLPRPYIHELGSLVLAAQAPLMDQNQFDLAA